MGSLEVEVSVSEADISTVGVDQTATVTFDALKDATFTGTVKSISPNGTSSSGVVNYTVTLSLKPYDERLKPDMTATADIATQVAENVLTVPSTAVKTDNGEKYVVVVAANGATNNQVVTTGVSDDSSTQIKSGLTEGAKVVTGSTTSSTSSSSSSSTKSTGGGLMMGGGGPPAGGGGPGGN
jgi:RND family efflux transporter MFP subunit